MSQPTRSTQSLLRPCLLALAITAIAGACNHDEHAVVTTEAHADAAGSAHDTPVQPMHNDAGHASDDHAGHDTATPELPTTPTTPWASDAPLREGMRRMHQAVNALGHAEHGHLDAAQSTAAAQQVQDAANFMFTNCKLAPEPDAALHGVLATLLSGAAAIKANPSDTTPVASMREAVALYPRMFEDLTWQADTAATQ